MDIYTKAYDNDVAFLQKNLTFINQKDQKGKSLLHYAILGSAYDVVDFLLSQDIDVNLKDSLGETPLFEAARKAKLKAAKLLISKYAKLDIQNTRLETPLHLAAFNGNLEMVKLLIENHANPNLKTKDDCLPIHYAILAGHLHVCKYLIDEVKIDFNTKDINQNTFLHYAAKTTNLSVLKFFIDVKLDPNALNDQFETPLFNAVKYGTKETVLELLKANAFIKIKNRRYETPLIVAKIYENDHLISLLEEYELSVDYQKYISDYGLIQAVLNRDVDKVKSLIQNGATLKKDHLKQNAFDYANQYKFGVLVSILRNLAF